MSSPEPSSPIIWPQPPQPLSEPSGLMSLQLEPVPEMSTIPPGERAREAQCSQGPEQSSFQLRKNRTETSPRPKDHHLVLQKKTDPASFLLKGCVFEAGDVEGACWLSEKLQSHIALLWGQRGLSLCLLAQPGFTEY